MEAMSGGVFEKPVPLVYGESKIHLTKDARSHTRPKPRRG